MARSRTKAPRRGERTIAVNRRARHDYEVLETFEAGIELKGSEVKSLREGKVSLADTYAFVDDRGEVWLRGLHIAPYSASAAHSGHDPDRDRKLLLHRHEIDHLRARTTQERLTLVPLSMYFDRGYAKVELAVARGRRLHDKRQVLARREAEREAARAIADARRGRR